MTARKDYVPLVLRERIAQQAQHRCGYYLCSEELLGMPMCIEHIKPQATGGKTIEVNLWLACRRCNEFKGAQTHARDPQTGKRVALFNPRRQVWATHFHWSADGTEIIGQTACGRATMVALQLNNSSIVVTRRHWFSVGWWPPRD